MSNIEKTIKKSFRKKTISSTLLGVIMSTFTTVTPMFLIMGGIALLYKLLHYDTVPYADRLFFSCSILYIFIFSLLTTTPLNAVLSRYISDKIFEEKYDAILSCFYGGLCLNMMLSALIGIPFFIYAYIVGGFDSLFLFTTYICYIALCLTFYAMLYLSITKDYAKISLFFLIGVIATILVALLANRIFGFTIIYSMIFSLACGFTVVALLEFSYVRKYFPNNDQNYFAFLFYLKKHWKLALTNLLYSLALYIHNFVFWTVPDRLIIRKTFVCYPPYDMASCIAMFTNISASVILITQIELHFHERYKAYSEAVIGGRLRDIEKAKKRMFSLMSYQLMDVVRNQFIISVLIFLLCMVFLPRLGFAGLVMEMYPCLAAGYFVIFLLYSCIIFLFYFNDANGSLMTAGTFIAATFLVSLFARNFPVIWYGIATFAGGICGWCVAYARLRYIERNLDQHIFCQGTLIPTENALMPPSQVYPDMESLFPKKAEKGKTKGANS